MSRSSLIVALALSVAAFAQSANPAPARTVASCGDIDSRLVYAIKTQRVLCPLARRVATQWGWQCAQLRTGSCLVTALYYCRYRNTGSESGSIKCIHDNDLRKSLNVQRVVFFVTAS